MNPEFEKIDEAREYLGADWTDERSKQALARVKRGYARRRTAKIGGGLAAVAAVCLAVPIVFGKLSPETLPHHDKIEMSSLSANVEVSDGFRVTPLEPTARFSVASVTESNVRIEVEQGRSHFDIERVPGRTYVIGVSGVELEVIGTSFDVDAREESVTIHLHEGSVAVTVADRGEAFIMSGEETRTIDLKAEVAVAPEQVEPAVAEPTAAPEEVAPEPAEDVAPAREPAQQPKPWRALAKKKEFKEASDIILKDPKVVDRKKVEELFDAADAMRRSGHHKEAAEYLDLIASDHARDSRSGMAAHTRGRILSRRLGNHCDAASSFAAARKLGLEGMLDRDALANETESLARCGQLEQAKKRLEEYRKQYPSGPHAERLESLIDQ